MNIEQTVRAKYAAVVTSNLTSAHDGVRAVAEAFGYAVKPSLESGAL
jgi:hypothetical protein